MAPTRSPPDSGHSRRTVLQTSVAALSAATVGGLAGCLGDSAPNDDGDGGATTKTYDVDSKLAATPDDCRQVQYVHAGDVLADPAVRALVDAQFRAQAGSDYHQGPSSYEEARETFDEQSPVALSGLHEVVSYTLAPDEESSYGNGVLLWTDWRPADVVSGVEQMYGLDLTETNYRGTRLFGPPERDDGHHYATRQYLGVLGDGRYVVGTRRGVEAAVDVATGNADPLGSQLRAAFDRTRGPIQFAMDVPQEQFAKQAESDTHYDDGGLVDPSVMRHVSHVYGSVYADGDVRVASLTLVAEDAGAAEELRKMVDGALAVARQNTEADGPVHAIVEDATASRDGARVTASVEATVDELEAVAEHLASQTTASGSSSGSDSASGSDTATPRPPVLVYTDASGSVANGTVESLSLTVELQDGADAVDLSTASVLVYHRQSETDQATRFRLVHESGSTQDRDGTFTANPTTLDEPGATATVGVDLGASSGLGVTPVGDAANPGDDLVVIVHSDGPGSVAAKFEIPDSLSGDSVDLTVPAERS